MNIQKLWKRTRCISQTTTHLLAIVPCSFLPIIRSLSHQPQRSVATGSIQK